MIIGICTGRMQAGVSMMRLKMGEPSEVLPRRGKARVTFKAYGHYTPVCLKLELWCFSEGGDQMVTQYIWPTSTKVRMATANSSSRDNCTVGCSSPSEDTLV